ncbi:MAG: cellulase family glycosylhydrolase [Chloroflexota bacterium]|nr:cellulase family glycosylhydrolase [Chloroflexota bacterium]
MKKLLTLVALLVLLLSLSGPYTPLLKAQADARTFPETGHTVGGQFLAYWQDHGGLAQQGYPISEEFAEVSPLNGQSYTVQYFERAVFEKHPENQPPFNILLSQLGTFRYKAKYPIGAPGQQANSQNAQHFTQTGHRLGGVFRSYWEAHGGLAQQGFPISDEFQEQSDLNGQSYKVQYFERAVFEYHPENVGTPYEVLLSQLGKYQLGKTHPNPAPAPEFSRQEFGIQESHVLWTNQSLASIQMLLDRVKAGGLKWLRFDVEWMDVETAPHQWNQTYLSRLDSVLSLMQARGIEPIAILQTAPSWAKAEGVGCWKKPGDTHQWAIPPNNPADYGAVASYLAKRYAGRIHTWEIWNEPNICDFWNTPSGPDAARYVQLLKVAYPAIKAADPNITVLGGALSGNDCNYLRDMYAAGAKGYFDALSIHPYSNSNPPDQIGSKCDQGSFASVPQIEQTMADLGDPNKPIWITEMGWSTQHGVSDADRATYFQQAVQLVRSWPYVKVFIAYYLDANGETPDGFEMWVNNTPTATWKAYINEVAKHP